MGLSEAALRRKLEALGYADALDEHSVPLVSKLVDDLVHTTESYRSLKITCARQATELQAFQQKLEGSQQVANQLQAEQAQLHGLLVKANEHSGRVETEAYQQAKRLEDRIAELAFWKQAAAEKLAAGERENLALKAKVAELVKLTDQLAAGAVEPQVAAPKVDVSTPPRTTPFQKSPVPAATVDLLQSANTRVLALQRQLADKDAQLQAAQQSIRAQQIALERHEKDVGHMGGRSTGDANTAALAARNEANESMILQLNSTVENLMAQVRDFEPTSREKARLEGQLAAAERARSEAEEKLRKAVRESEAIQHEVLQLRADVTMLQTTTAKSSPPPPTELDSAMNSVSGLRTRLAESRAEQDRLKTVVETLVRERSAATAQASALQQELDSLKGALAEARAFGESHHAQAQALRAECTATREQLEGCSTGLEEAVKRLGEVHGELESCKADLAVQRGDKQTAEARVLELQQRLEAIEASAGSEHSTNLALASKLAKLESDLRAAQAGLRAADASGKAQSAQLQEANEARVRISGQLSAAEEERGRLQRECAAAAQAAMEERARADALSVARTDLEVEMGRLRAELGVLTAERGMLEERVSVLGSQLSAGQSDWGSAQRELSQLQGLPARLEDLQGRLRDTVAQLAASEAESARANAEAGRLGEALMRAQDEKDSTAALLSHEREVVATLRTQMEEAEQRGLRAESDTRASQAAHDRLLAEHRACVADLAALREALAAEGSAAKDAEQGTRSLHARAVALQRQLGVKEEECERVTGMLQVAEQVAEGARAREEEARTSGRELAERARKAEALVAEYEADIGQLRAAREGSAAHIKQLETMLGQMREELEARRQEVEQLTTLSLRGDATVQEYMANIKAMSADLRAAEMRVADLVSELAAREDAASRAQAEAADLRRVVAAMDSERDGLQGELDTKAEDLLALTTQHDTLRAQVEDTQRLLSMAEGRLAHTDARARDAEAEASALREQVSGALASLQAVSAERDALATELAAVGEDLEALVKENQVVSNELAELSQQHERQADELRRVSARSGSAEQLVRAKEAEVEDLRRAYEGLALDNRRLQSSVSQLEREAASREALLSAKADEVESLTAASQATQAQCSQYVMDLQAFERQVDSLSRQLAHSESEAEELNRGHEVLVEELRVATQVRLGLERHREELQQQIAALDSQVAIARARLEDAGAEASSLGQRLALERNKVTELEALMAGMRAREYKTDLVSKHGGSQVAIMQERNRILEEQVTTLQHQVTSLQQSREAQDHEVSRLHAEVLGLVAAQQQQQLEEEEAGIGVHGVGGAGAIAAEAAEMAARVVELERRCAQLQSEVGAAHKGLRTAQEALNVATREAVSLQEANARLQQQQQRAEAEALASKAAPSQHSPKGTAGPEERAARLSAKLQDEQAKRRQAERDFLELMQSIEEGGSGGGAGGGPSQPGKGAGVLASQRLSVMQAKMEALEQEKQQLEEHMAKTRSLMLAMQTELQHIHAEYGIVSSTLQQVLEQQLDSNVDGSMLEGGGSSVADSASHHTPAPPHKPMQPPHPQQHPPSVLSANTRPNLSGAPLAGNTTPVASSYWKT